MLLHSVFAKLFYRIFPMFLSLYLSLAGTVPAAPGTEQPITPKQDGVCVTFAALADPQISNYMAERYPVFEAAAADLHNNDGTLDAVIMAGDIAENGLDMEYQLVYDKLSGLNTRYLIGTGNHDIRLRAYNQTVNRFCTFVNALNGDNSVQALNYSETVNGCKFIMLGSDRTVFEEAYFSDSQLDWLQNELASADGKPVFVICHQPLKLTHGLPDTWGSPIDSAGSVGDQSDTLLNIFKQFPNVFFITGHLHTGFGQYTYETAEGVSLVNLPSLCIKNKDGDENGPGIGFIVEVYEQEVLFRARNFAKGEWVPAFDFSVPVTAVK